MYRPVKRRRGRKNNKEREGEKGREKERKWQGGQKKWGHDEKEKKGEHHIDVEHLYGKYKHVCGKYKHGIRDRLTRERRRKSFVQEKI